jgi:DNA-binding NarL/FixJ family response regulator
VKILIVDDHALFRAGLRIKASQLRLQERPATVRG